MPTTALIGERGAWRGAWRISALLTISILGSCASGVQPPVAFPEPVPEHELCPIGPQPDAPNTASNDDRPIVFMLPGPVDPSHAPVPFTPAERILFGQLYETLLRVNCQGRVEGELAESWSVSEDSLEWTFIVREDARDWNGDRLTATTVAESWLAAAEPPPVDAVANRAAAMIPPPRITALTALDTRRVRARLSEPVEVEWFARPELAVARPSLSGAGWPVGTGPVHPVDLFVPSADPARSLSVISLMGAVPLEARSLTGDPRSALEAGADLLVTNDPQVIDYAAASPSLTATPLAWSRSYLLLTPVGAPIVRPLAPPPNELRTTPSYPLVRRPPEAALSALARDAVPIGARPTTDGIPQPFECAAPPPISGPVPTNGPPALPTPIRSILYPVGDPVARSLAERLTALAMSAQASDRWLAESVPGLTITRLQGRPSAVGFAPAEFARALNAGWYPAYVVPTERVVTMGGCGRLSHLRDLAPWLGLEPATIDSAPSILPLIDTRNTLVLRNGIAGAAVDGSGVIQLGGVRRTSPETPR